MFTIFGSENQEVFTIFGSENPEVFTIFGFENLGSLMFYAIQSGVPGGEAPRESSRVWAAARPPNEGDVIFWRGDDTISGDGQGRVDLTAVARSLDR